MNRHVCVAVLVAASMFTGPAVRAQEAREQPLQEVFQTRLVYPQERGEVQFTLASSYGSRDGSSRLQLPLSLEYGLTSHWQVGLEWDTLRRREGPGEPTSSGPGDVGIGTQLSFTHVLRTALDAAVGFELTIPVGNLERDLTEGFIGYEPYLAVARDFPVLGDLHLFSEVAIEFVQRTRRHADPADDEPAAHEFSVGLGALMPVRDAVITGEVNLSTNRWNNGGQERAMYVTPGVVWPLLRHWEVGAGTPIGLTPDAARFGAILKVTYEFQPFDADAEYRRRRGMAARENHAGSRLPRQSRGLR